jgi:hypothetical protein
MATRSLQSDLGLYQSPDAVAAQFNLAQTTGNALCTLGGNLQGVGPCDQTVTLAYWNPSGSGTLGGFLVAWPWHETLASYRWAPTSGTGSGYNFNLAATTTSPLPGGASAGYAGGTLAITVNTADTSGDAIVWATVFPVTCTGTSGNPYSSAGRECPGYLVAYSLDPAHGGTYDGALTLIWPSGLPSTPDFQPSPFAIPTAVNGYVYAPAYGLYDSGTGLYDLSGVQAYVF